jgi:membrane-bound serine protease (ClpP class)
MVLVLLLCLLLAGGRPAAADARPVIVIDLQGPIGVATELHLNEAIEAAGARSASLLIVRLNTPGGLVSSTRAIIQKILALDFPVVVYVSPAGGHAASAGTYIAYAAHIIAMAPGTNIGAATPIQLGGVPGLPGTPEPRPQDRDSPGSPAGSRDGAADMKAVNDAAAFLRSLAQLRGRNAEWAEKAVRSAATLSAEDALKEQVIDYVASDLTELLGKLDGRMVQVGQRSVNITTKGEPIVVLSPGWRVRVLSMIADPNVAFLLMLVGIYGIVFEMYSPGLVGPGVLGAISLILGLVALTVLPVQQASLLLVVVGIAFMLFEAFTPGFGIAGFGGLAAFIAGAAFLFDPAQADIDIRIGLPLLVSAAAVTAIGLMVVGAFALKARKRAVVSGREQLLGSIGQVLTWQEGSGSVRVMGEVWSATSRDDIHVGQAVRVVSRHGLTLEVKGTDTWRN